MLIVGFIGVVVIGLMMAQVILLPIGLLAWFHIPYWAMGLALLSLITWCLQE